MKGDWLAEPFQNKQTSILHEWPQSRDSFHFEEVSRYLRSDSSLKDVLSLRNHSNHYSHHMLPSKALFPPLKLSWKIHMTFLISTQHSRDKACTLTNPAGIFKQNFTKVAKNSIRISELEE